MSPASSSNDGEMLRQRVFALRDQVRKDGGDCKENDHESDGNRKDENDVDGGRDAMNSGSILVIDSTVLTSTIVPAMKELLKERNGRTIIEEKKDANDARRTSREEEPSDDNPQIEYTVAILKCLVAFVAATCAPPESQESPTSAKQQQQQQTSYNSLSFKRSSTPKKDKRPPSPSKSRFSLTPKEDKDLFVNCGAFSMALSMLRQILEDYVNKASADSWSRNKSADLDTFDSIGVADSSADVKIESTMPENEIPALVMHMIACLTHNASDSIKSDVVLPHLTAVVHKSMMVFLPSPEVQAYGCRTLYNLSNPLLQELIAAGSVSVLVRAMKCHHTDARVQEHGNKSLYNLLHLLVYCTNQSHDHGEAHKENETNPQNPISPPAPPSVLIEIDGEKLEDYSSLLPSLPAIVIRGMEFHSDHLAIQQYGLLVLTRLCQQDKEKYEVIVSEGGLTALLDVVTMATKAKLDLQISENLSGYGDDTTGNDSSSMAEKYDCLAQMACQFLRDISRPTNSSMDILRIIAVKGGMKTVLKLLDHYNQENMKCGGAGGSSNLNSYYGNSQKFAIINIIDPAMACLRNLMTNEDNRTEVMTFTSISKAMKNDSSSAANPYADDDDIHICANLIPIVLKTMDAYPLDAPIQAYGCDLLGRLAQGEQSARIELIQTSIDPDAFSASGRASRNLSRLWKKADSIESGKRDGSSSSGAGGSEEEEDADVVDLSDQLKSSVISTSPRYKKHVDALVTAVRAMRNHRHHQGVQERAVTLILAMVVDRDLMLNGGNPNGTSSSSSYLIQRLQEVYELNREAKDASTLHGFLQATPVPPKGVERLKTLIKIVEEYDRKTSRGGATDDPGGTALNKGRAIGQMLFGGWNKQAGGQ